MNYQAAIAKMRELFHDRMWALDVKTLHFSDGTESLNWIVGCTVDPGKSNKWESCEEPTFEAAVEKLLRIIVGGKPETKTEEVGEVALPEKDPQPSEMPAAKRAADPLSF